MAPSEQPSKLEILLDDFVRFKGAQLARSFKREMPEYEAISVNLSIDELFTTGLAGIHTQLAAKYRVLYFVWRHAPPFKYLGLPLTPWYFKHFFSSHADEITRSVEALTNGVPLTRRSKPMLWRAITAEVFPVLVSGWPKARIAEELGYSYETVVRMITELHRIGLVWDERHASTHETLKSLGGQMFKRLSKNGRRFSASLYKILLGDPRLNIDVSRAIAKAFGLSNSQRVSLSIALEYNHFTLLTDDYLTRGEKIQRFNGDPSNAANCLAALSRAGIYTQPLEVANAGLRERYMGKALAMARGGRAPPFCRLMRGENKREILRCCEGNYVKAVDEFGLEYDTENNLRRRDSFSEIYRLLLKRSGSARTIPFRGCNISTFQKCTSDMKRAGLLNSDRRRNEIFYSINTEGIRAIVNGFLDGDEPTTFRNLQPKLLVNHETISHILSGYVAPRPHLEPRQRERLDRLAAQCEKARIPIPGWGQYSWALVPLPESGGKGI